MLLHKRRLEGNLILAAAYQNPYGTERLCITSQVPLTYDDYQKNLNLISEMYDDYQTKIEKDDYKTQIGLPTDEQKQNPAGQGGAGIIDSVSTLYQGLKSVSNLYSGSIGTKVKNYYGRNINPHPNWSPGFVGEKHMIHSSGNTYNFLGPGTHIDERVQRGDVPMDSIDAVAKTHDIAYSRARNLKDVRRADKAFVKGIKRSSAGKVSKAIVAGAIKAKMVAEDLGVLDPNRFSKVKDIEVIDEEDTNIQGTGQDSKMSKSRKMGKYPDSHMRNKLYKQYKKSRKKLIRKIPK